MDSLYIVMPAYNEEENIERTVKQWYPLLEGKDDRSKLVVADSGSSDGTHDILRRLEKEYCKLVILSHTEKQHGPKVIALYDYAVNNGADYIFQTDSDGQTDPEEFMEFWKMRTEYDGIFGNRMGREDGKDRVFVEHIVCFLLKMYFGVAVPDANAPFRLMKTDTVKKYLYLMPVDYDLPNIMMTTYFVYYNEKVMFKEVSFKPRQGGKNSVDIYKIIRIGWKALGNFRKFRKGLSK